MRTPLVVGFVSLLAACGDSGISGLGGGGDDVQDTDAGVDANLNVARIELSVDKPSIDTELRLKHDVTVTVTSFNGFAGDVTLTAQAFDGTNTALTDWTTAFDTSTVNVAANGTATAKVTLTVPTKFAGATDTLKISATSSAAPVSVTSTLNVENQITYHMKADMTACTFPTDYGHIANRDIILVGTKMRWFNDGQVGVDPNFVIHINSGDAYGFSHQAQGTYGTADPTTEPQTAYEQTAITDSNTDVITWYCHDPDTGSQDTSVQGALEIQ